MAKSIKIRAKARGNVCDVKALMKHPMETGLRKDKKTGKVIPAHFIQEVTIALNGNTAVSAEWGGAISKDPYVAVKLSGAKKGDTVTLKWVDNKGNSDSAETKVG